VTPDLTRWNRAGLSRFQYVDANAVTMLEDLRAALEANWPSPNSEWRSDPNGTLESQYEHVPPEMGWQLSRVLARACHIALGYLDAYANEGFLGTATQWENVRRMVAMLGYRPVPPASASTPLALHLKAELSGKIAAGLAVRYAPTSGDPPVVFETLSDLDGDASLNALHIEGYGTNMTPLASQQPNLLTLESVPAGVRTGEPIVLESATGDDPALEAHIVTGIQGSTLTLGEPIGASFLTGQTVVHVAPTDRLRVKGPTQLGSARLPSTLHLSPGGPSISSGEIVIVSDRTNTVYARVTGQRRSRLVLATAVGPMDIANATVSRPIDLAIAGFSPARETTTPPGATLFLLSVAGDWSRLRGAKVAAALPGTLIDCTVTAADYTPPGATATGKLAKPAFTVLTLQVPSTPTIPRNMQKLLVPPPTLGPWTLDQQLARQAQVSGQGTPQHGRGTLPRQLQVSQPKHSGPGGPIVLVRLRQRAWGRIAGIDQLPDGTTAAIRTDQPLQEVGGGAFYLSDSTAFAGFKATVRPADWQRNETPVTDAQLVLDSPATALRPGRAVIVNRTDSPEQALATTVVSVSSDGTQVQLADQPPDGSEVGNIEIAGNVVLAGHGSRRGTLTLGSGDATQARQTFSVKASDISWVADPSMPNGVRADLDVHVGGVRWLQVGSLDDSKPADTTYEVQIREDGGLSVVFGDGQNGRRLPSGVNNVVAGYRTGVGLAGNLPAASLTALVTPHPLVAAVLQPIAAGGGADLEPTDSMRSGAPATVLTLGRAVSLTDFGYLAASQSSVWQAVALPVAESGTGESVGVVVVPAGGGSLTPTLKASLETFLAARALPGVTATVSGYRNVVVSIGVLIRVDQARFDPGVVKAAVTAALLDAFTLPKRQLGQTLHRSEVFRVVEAIDGVASSECWISLERGILVPLDKVQRLRAQPFEVLVLASSGWTLHVSAEALQ
jgi:predicted phage baseplate assembly protein